MLPNSRYETSRILVSRKDRKGKGKNYRLILLMKTNFKNPKKKGVSKSVLATYEVRSSTTSGTRLLEVKFLLHHFLALL